MLTSIANKRVFKNAVVCFFLWVFGFFIAFSLFNHHVPVSMQHRFHLTQPYRLIGANTIRAFVKIFLTNTGVALLLSVGGYFTGGLLAVFISLWNGIKLGLIFGKALFHFSLIYLLTAFIHGPFEIAAFSWFGGLGLLGFLNVRKIWKKEKPTLHDFPDFKNFVPPLALLLMAAVIETSLFVFNS
jgi:hypothetical protein